MKYLSGTSFFYASVMAEFPKLYVHNGMKNAGSSPVWCSNYKLYLCASKFKIVWYN